MKRGVVWATAGLVVLNLLMLVVFLFRSGPARERASRSAPAVSTTQMFAVTGVVRELKPDGSNLIIAHEPIPGFMDAMTMPFRTRDPREIASVKAGDRLTFRLLVTEEESWIDQVERVDSPAEGTVPAPGPEPIDIVRGVEPGEAGSLPGGPGASDQVRRVRDVEPLNVGDPVPDYVFTNQFGKRVRLSDFRGHALGLTFIFTRCPLPDFCPRMLNHFSAAAKRLSEEPRGATNWHLLTVTIDPQFDTPAVLKTHAERQAYDPRRWSFLTGAMIDIDALTEQLGLVFRRQTPTAFVDHNLRTVVINVRGELQKVFIGNLWKPEELITEMRTAAAVGDPVSPPAEP